MNANDVIRILDLKPLPGEGGFFRETYRSHLKLPNLESGGKSLENRSASTAIFFMVTPQTFSVLHRLPQDEIFHAYSGATSEMLIIDSSGSHKLVKLGSNIENGEMPQIVVPSGSWQGLKLATGETGYALIGTTVAPGFEFQDMEIKTRKELLQMFPHIANLIESYTLET